MTDAWYRGSNREDRIQAAMGHHGYDALLAVTPENAHYLAGHGNYIATHWRVPGLFSAAVGRGNERVEVRDRAFEVAYSLSGVRTVQRDMRIGDLRDDHCASLPVSGLNNTP